MVKVSSKPVVFDDYMEYRRAVYNLFVVLNGLRVSENELLVMDALDRFVGDNNDITREVKEKVMNYTGISEGKLNAILAVLRRKGYIDGHLLKPVFRLRDNGYKITFTVIYDEEQPSE